MTSIARAQAGRLNSIGKNRDPYEKHTVRGGRDRDWTLHAACRGHDPEMWFPETAARNNETAAAIKICDNCPVRAQCRDYADALDIPFGIWGGQRQSERGFKWGLK